MKKIFWMFVVLVFAGLFMSNTVNAQRGHNYHRQEHRREVRHAYRNGYRHGARAEYRYHRHPRVYAYGGYRHHPRYRRYHRPYRRGAEVRVVVPAPPRPRVIIRP